MKKVNIYALLDPVSKQVRYVGKTKYKLNVRLSQHIRDKNSKTHKFKWINSLKINGLTPEILLIEEVDEFEWEQKEIAYIKLFRNLGYNMTNTLDGGMGTKGSIGFKHSEEFKKRQSKMMIMRNKNNPLPKKFYEELANSKKKPILKISISGNFICEYDSTYDAARSIADKNNVDKIKNIANAITNSLKGRSNSAHGFKWEYKFNNLKNK